MIDPTLLDGLSVRLEELERRVAVLERGQKVAEPEPSRESFSSSPRITPAPPPQGSGFFSVAGRAMLGIAGAYLLRAFVESHWISGALLAPFAIANALAWLFAATRSSRPLARYTYTCTSVLILAPMLWELTMRFNVLPPWADALALAALATLAIATPQTDQNPIVLRIAGIAVATLALALAVATHSNLPFLAVLLLLVAVGELPAIRPTLGWVRGVMALAADLGVWIFIYIYRGPHSDYPQLSAAGQIAPGFALFAIAAVSTACAVAIRRERIRLFETVQTIAAFLLAACGLIYFWPYTGFAVLGAICLGLAATAYAALFTVLRAETQRHNRALFGAWSAALLLVGSFLCLPAHWRTEGLGLSAFAATAASSRMGLQLLAVHGNAFLMAAVVVSGLGAYAWQALAGASGNAPAYAVFVTLAIALACYGMIQRNSIEFARQFSYLSVSVIAIGVAALLAHSFISLAELRFSPGAQHLALIRSFILCSIALALAVSGSMWNRRELTHIAYAVVALEAFKLLAEDLRHGHLAYVAASVCLFAMTLITLPRVAKRTAA